MINFKWRDKLERNIFGILTSVSTIISVPIVQFGYSGIRNSCFSAGSGSVIFLHTCNNMLEIRWSLSGWETSLKVLEPSKWFLRRSLKTIVGVKGGRRGWGRLERTWLELDCGFARHHVCGCVTPMCVAYNSAAYIFIPKDVCDVTCVMGFRSQMTILSLHLRPDFENFKGAKIRLCCIFHFSQCSLLWFKKKKTQQNA